MRRYFSSTIATFLTVALLAPFAWAQGGPPQQQQPPQPPKSTLKASDVTDQDLEAVADIFIDMQSVKRKYMPQMQNVNSRKEAMKLRRQMAQEAQQIVAENEQIEMDRLQQIQLLARQDTTFQKRLTEHIKAKAKSDGLGQGKQDDSGS